MNTLYCAGNWDVAINWGQWMVGFNVWNSEYGLLWNVFLGPVRVGGRAKWRR